MRPTSRSLRHARRLLSAGRRPHATPIASSSLFHRPPGVSSVRAISNLVPASTLTFGQPLPETHPHIVQPTHLTPSIPSLTYHHRRQALSRLLSPNTLAILPSARTQYRSGSVFYPFHQSPNFYYLTGHLEPSCLAIIHRHGVNPDDFTFHLYARPKDAAAEVWEGGRSGVQALSDVFNADESGDINDVGRVLPELFGAVKGIYTDELPASSPAGLLSRLLGTEPRDEESDRLAKLLLDKTVAPLRPLMNELRRVKDDGEIECMRIAGRASGRAFTDAMRQSWQGEKDLADWLKYEFRRRGCTEEAYVPVVAGGRNALGIHYVRNDAAMSDQELILVDAGGEYGGYVTDITRTWPISGRFSPAQRDLYEVVLNTQRQLVSLCREDADVSLDELHAKSEEGMRTDLETLGFDLRDGAMGTLFPHHVSHHVGLDVHDLPGWSRKTKIKAGECITIEPGIYVPTDPDPRFPAHFRGMGIRIEDSVCVREKSVEVLTTEAVKEVVDIEALRS